MSTLSPTTPAEQSTLHIFGIVAFVAMCTLICGLFSLNYAQASMDRAKLLKEKHVADEIKKRQDKLKIELEEKQEQLKKRKAVGYKVVPREEV